MPTYYPKTRIRNPAIDPPLGAGHAGQRLTVWNTVVLADTRGTTPLTSGPLDGDVYRMVRVPKGAVVIGGHVYASRFASGKKKLVAASPRGDWPSRVNSGMTHNQALDVLEAALKTHPDDLRLDATRRGFLYARNVLKECRARLADAPEG